MNENTKDLLISLLVEKIETLTGGQTDGYIDLKSFVDILTAKVNADQKRISDLIESHEKLSKNVDDIEEQLSNDIQTEVREQVKEISLENIDCSSITEYIDKVDENAREIKSDLKSDIEDLSDKFDDEHEVLLDRFKILSEKMDKLLFVLDIELDVQYEKALTKKTLKKE